MGCRWHSRHAVSPWYIHTPLTEPVLSQPESLEKILARTSMQRVGTPEEVAAAIAFLLHGQSLLHYRALPDGGWRLPEQGALRHKLVW